MPSEGNGGRLDQTQAPFPQPSLIYSLVAMLVVQWTPPPIRDGPMTNRQFQAVRREG